MPLSRRRLAPLAALVPLLAALPAPAQQAGPAAADSVARVDQVFARWNNEHGPGCAVGVSRDGRTLLTRAYGRAHLEHPAANTPETVFEAGSVSKQFTAAAVLLLAQQGKLSLDDPVRKHIPELPPYGDSITLRQMLNHTSGLRDWGTVVAVAGWPRGTRTHTQAHALEVAARQKELNFRPGAEYLYSNTNYNLAAIVVERVSGTSFAEFTRQHLFLPLGMTSTQWRDDYNRVVKGRATAYAPVAGGLWTQNMPFEHVHGNGGLLTTVGDLLRWAQNFSDPRVGGASFAREMEQRGRLAKGSEIRYALGLFVSDFEGVPEVAHDGTTAAYNAFLGRYPGQRLAVAVLCNAGNVNPSGVGHDVARIFLAGQTRPAAEAAASAESQAVVATEQLSALAGLYRSERDHTTVTLSVANGRLQVQGGPVLAALSPTRFQAPGGGSELRFGAAGREMLRLTADGDTIRYVRAEAWTPAPAELAELAGEYASDEAEVTVRLEVEGGKLRLVRRLSRPIELVPTYRDGALAPGAGIVWFHRDAAGKVTGFSLGSGRVRDLRFRRVAER